LRRAPRYVKGVSVPGNDRGQATAEYALVIVAAAIIALALILWASNSDALPAFFDAVVRKVRGVVDAAP
jgi:hypothetical protein